MARYVCIHGHFYQPPRENPWLEAVQLQPSAQPYHDWNERVTAECYAANASSRILDEKGLIKEMVNNYAGMSFNFGPTLLSWLEIKAPDVYEAILQADLRSRKSFSGHGSAMAQPYNHMIMPLANSRDKRTQIIWGIRDFTHRFKRMPEGMWLPETAVDLESLDIMAEYGIAFTVLAPHQAKRTRRLGSFNWESAGDGTLDITRPYMVRLPSGRSISVFFYNGAVSRAVAFERLLNDGETFAKRLLEVFKRDERPQLSHIATDGETYGHHHRFGDMALAYALRYLPAKEKTTITVYGEYLEKHPPRHEAEIIENTSWSCAPGVERWRTDCGCRLGGEQGWNQAWRRVLRDSMDWLRDSLALLFERHAAAFFRDPWEARNDYISVILDRSPGGVEAFLSRHCYPTPTHADKITVLRLLEMQRNAMLMYTSCGWFFDDPSGIETLQVMEYAARAIELANKVSGKDLEEEFLYRLSSVKSNKPGKANGRELYEQHVRPQILGLERVAAHCAITSVFKNQLSQRLFCYSTAISDRRTFKVGRTTLATGIVNLRSDITWEEGRFCFAVLHMGDHNVVCGIRKDDTASVSRRERINRTFMSGNIPEALRLLDREYQGGIHSIESLIKDGQNQVLDMILEPTLSEARNVYRKLYEGNAPLMRFLKDAGATPPRMLYLAAEAVLNDALERAFLSLDRPESEVVALLEEARTQGVKLDEEQLDYAARKGLVSVGQAVLKHPFDEDALSMLLKGVSLLDALPFRVNLWDVQNVVYKIVSLHSGSMREAAKAGDPPAADWLDKVAELCRRLFISPDLGSLVAP